MKLQELRTMGKELGVDSPTTYPKRELVLKIMEKNGIVVDQNDLPAPPKRRGGRQKKDRSQDALGLEEPTYAEPLAQEDIAVQVEEPGVQPLREASWRSPRTDMGSCARKTTCPARTTSTSPSTRSASSTSRPATRSRARRGRRRTMKRTARCSTSRPSTISPRRRRSTAASSTS